MEGTNRGAVEWGSPLHVSHAADGCFSNFRTTVLGKSARQSPTQSYIVGAVRYPSAVRLCGTVALVKDVDRLSHTRYQNMMPVRWRMP